MSVFIHLPFLPDRYVMFLLLSQLGRPKWFIYVGGGGVLRNHWLHAKPATVNFRKSFGLLICLPCKILINRALYARIIWVDPGTSAWGFLFECSHMTLHPHPLSKDLVKYPLGKGKTQHCLVLLQSLAFLNGCDQYDHHFLCYLFL